MLGVSPFSLRAALPQSPAFFSRAFTRSTSFGSCRISARDRYSSMKGRAGIPL